MSVKTPALPELPQLEADVRRRIKRPEAVHEDASTPPCEERKAVRWYEGYRSGYFC